MSHGPSTGGIKAEPNLIPLLDLVFQLIMFFMIVTNFALEQFTIGGIELPEAQSARPLDVKEKYILFLNMNSKGELVFPRKAGEPPPEPMSEPGVILLFLKGEHKDAENLEQHRGENMLVVIRADQGAEYQHLLRLVRLVKDAGFKKPAQLRAVIKNK